MKTLYILIICILLSGCMAAKGESIGSPAEKYHIENLGIQVIALRLSAEGAILDFRYKALDPEKAQILFSREIKPYLIHENTGKAVAVPSPPKIGPLRQTTNQPVAGKHYFMLFGNPGKFIQRGDQVTLVHGEHRIEGLVVE